MSSSTSPITPQNSSPSSSSSSSKSRRVDTSQLPPPISKTVFYTGSLGIISASMLVGVFRVFKKENFKPSASNPGAAMAFQIAAKALIYGTALCLGSFAGAGALFAYTSKITTVEEFAPAAKIAIAKYLPFIPSSEKQWDELTTEEKIESEEAVETMTQWMNEIFGDGTTKTDDEKKKDNTDKVEGIDKKEHDKTGIGVGVGTETETKKKVYWLGIDPQLIWRKFKEKYF